MRRNLIALYVAGAAVATLVAANGAVRRHLDPPLAALAGSARVRPERIADLRASLLVQQPVDRPPAGPGSSGSTDGVEARHQPARRGRAGTS